MIRILKMYLLLSLLLLTGNSFAQSGEGVADLERQLNRLENKIREAKNLVQSLNNPELNEPVQQAELQYQQARTTFQTRQYIRCRNHIRLAYGYLVQLYQYLKSNTDFIRRYQDRLDQKIQEAEQLVSQSQNTEAAKLLNKARYYRQKALQMFNGEQPEGIFRNYFIAMYFAENASRLAGGQDGRDSQDFNRYIEDSRELLRQVEELAASETNELIRNFIQKATSQLSEVQNLYDQKLYRQAVQRLLLVNRFLYRALDLLDNQPASLGERINSDLQSLDAQISDLQSEVTANTSQEVRRLYERIIFLTAEAREKFQLQEYHTARQRISLANRLLYQLRRLLNRPVDTPEIQIENQIQTAEIMLNTLQSELLDYPDSQNMLQLLEKTLQKAKDAYSIDNEKLAWQYLRFFNSLAIKLNQLKTASTGSAATAEIGQESLNRLKTMLDNLPNSWQQDEALQFKYENAGNLYQIAQSAFQQGNYSLCNEMSRLAINLIIQ